MSYCTFELIRQTSNQTFYFYTLYFGDKSIHSFFIEKSEDTLDMNSHDKLNYRQLFSSAFILENNPKVIIVSLSHIWIGLFGSLVGNVQYGWELFSPFPRICLFPAAGKDVCNVVVLKKSFLFLLPLRERARERLRLSYVWEKPRIERKKGFFGRHRLGNERHTRRPFTLTRLIRCISDIFFSFPPLRFICLSICVSCDAREQKYHLTLFSSLRS